MGTKLFAGGVACAASHAPFKPSSYLFFHIIRLALQLLDHPVQLSYLALVVSQVVTELAPAAVELLQLSHRKRMDDVNAPESPLPGKVMTLWGCTDFGVPKERPDVTSAQTR